MTHIAIIMDGNRRWASDNNLPKAEGHRRGAEKLKELIQWCKEDGIKTLTFYALSTENLKREKDELNALFSLFKEYFTELYNKKEIMEDSVKINFPGNISLLPEDIQEIIRKTEEKTKNNKNYIINFCIAYGGHDEIIHAVNKAVEKGKKVTEKEFEKLLYISDQPDIVIRTGGNIRTSNFLPWQTAYSEWFFTNTYWPAFSKKEFDSIIEEFGRRKRNFGK